MKKKKRREEKNKRMNEGIEKEITHSERVLRQHPVSVRCPHVDRADGEANGEEDGLEREREI